MFSNLILFLIALSGLSPILFILWLVDTIQNYRKMSFYLELSSLAACYSGAVEILRNHGLLLLFLLILIFSKAILKKAVKTLTPLPLNVKSIKSADINFVTILISYILPWFKFAFTTDHDLIYIFGFGVICLVYAVIMKNSYHYNVNFRLFFGYKNYEVQTVKEVTYLVLSKKNLKNKNQITKCVQLADFMLIDITE